MRGCCFDVFHVYFSFSRFFYLLESNFDTPSTTQKIRNYIPTGVSCIKGSLRNTSKSHTSEHLQSQHTPFRTLNLSKMQHVTTYCASIEAITSASRSHYLCAVPGDFWVPGVWMFSGFRKSHNFTSLRQAMFAT